MGNPDELAARWAREVSYRDEVVPEDRHQVRRIVESSGYFNPGEVNVAVELVEERLAKGPACGYYFVFAERDGQMLGYTCYGPIAATAGSFDLYWIAVDQGWRGRGIGRALLGQTEARIRAMGGRRVYIETSDRPQYGPTRAFYEKAGYRKEAVLKDFYGPGDDKAIYVKRLE